jgi:hypothetical protein
MCQVCKPTGRYQIIFDPLYHINGLGFKMWISVVQEVLQKQVFLREFRLSWTQNFSENEKRNGKVLCK